MDYKFKKKNVSMQDGIDHTFRFYIFTHVKRVKFKSLLLNEYIYIYVRYA